MTEPMPEKSRSRQRRSLATLALWIGLFVTLLMTLPRWSLRLRCGERVTPQILTDDTSTLIAFSIRIRRSERNETHYTTWPIRFVDLSTGRERVLNRPEESAELPEILDPYLGLRRASGKYSLHTIDEENGLQQSGDYIALTYETIDERIPEKRLQVVNWRSGEVVLDAPFEGDYRFFGQRLLVSQHEGGWRLEIWQPREKRIESADWLVGYHDLDGTVVSPDGRWLTLRGSTSLWDVTQGKEHFKLPEGIEDAVFSPDGTRLVLVERFEQGEPGHRVRRWRCFDTASGALLREEQERLEWPDNRSPPRAPGALRYLRDGQTVRYDQRGGATEWSPLGLKRQEEEVESVEFDLPSVSGGWFVGGSPDRKWAVAAVERHPPIVDLYNRITDLFGIQQGGWSAPPCFYDLWNLETRRQVATLGPGSTQRCWFTSDSRQLVTHTEQGLLVWPVPPGPPWGRALTWSLAVPLAAGVWTFLGGNRSRRFWRRRDNQGTSTGSTTS